MYCIILVKKKIMREYRNVITDNRTESTIKTFDNNDNTNNFYPKITKVFLRFLTFPFCK